MNKFILISNLSLTIDLSIISIFLTFIIFLLFLKRVRSDNGIRKVLLIRSYSILFF